jgi:hypothetical protein
MFGQQVWRTVQDASVVSGTTMGAVCEVKGATAIYLYLATFATAANFQVCVGNTASSAQILPLYYNSFTGGTVPFLISTAASSGIYINVSQAVGWKYLKVQASIAMVDGATLSVYAMQ